MPEDARNKEDDDVSKPLAGERLAAARRDQDIALRDIAKELHLDEPKVQALEQNRFDSLGAPVFARGHLRKYAEIVGIDGDEVAAEYDQLGTGHADPPIVGTPRATSRDIDLTRYIAPVVVAALVLLAGILWYQAGSPLPSFDRAEQTSNASIELPRPAETPAPAPDEGDEAVAQSEPATDAAVADTTPEDATPAATVSGSETEAPEPVAAASGPQVSLGLVFGGNCWTEVTDADGQRLFFDLGSEGRSVTVSGSAPLRVLFGNYENVSVAVNGTSYPIPASARRGETARFTVNAP